jgi:hypothetical protein
MSALAMVPNGVAHGAVADFSRRFVRAAYPTNIEEAEAAGITAENWRPEWVGFWVDVLENPNGAEERAESLSWKAYLAAAGQSDAKEMSDDDFEAAEASYLRSIAWRVQAWGATANGEPIPAPGDPRYENAWESFYAIPSGLRWWVIGRVRVAHLPKRKSPTLPSATGSIPSSPSDPATAPPPS